MIKHYKPYFYKVRHFGGFKFGINKLFSMHVFKIGFMLIFTKFNSIQILHEIELGLFPYYFEYRNYDKMFRGKK